MDHVSILSMKQDNPEREKDIVNPKSIKPLHGVELPMGLGLTTIFSVSSSRVGCLVLSFIPTSNAVQAKWMSAFAE